MSNAILVDTLLIISGVILITELSLLVTDDDADKDWREMAKLDGHASAQVISLSTLGLLSSLSGMFLRAKMESKVKPESHYTCLALVYVIVSISGILVAGAFIMINWSLVNQTYAVITSRFLCSSMMASAYLITFSLAILNFLFADFMSLDEEDVDVHYAKIDIV